MKTTLTRDQWALVGIIAGGILFILFTFTIGVYIVVIDYFILLTIVISVTIAFYMTSVKFHSPMCVTEGDNFTTFDSRSEVLYDTGWGHHLGLVYVSGYNAPKRVFSRQDVELGGRAVVIVTPSTFMIESVGNGRFLAVRGTPLESNYWESKAFLNRPGIKTKLRDEFKRAKVLFALQSKSLHEDETPESVSTLGDLATTLHKWRGEIAGTADMFSEEFKRRLSSIKAFRESNLDRLARTREAQKSQEEEKHG